ncbi:ABC transporter substrate-binding protein [Bradyrhizobium arachidis]|uniref:ABC transporter substrate-binding protein n=1 Tax=Bradyrhizobium arachidis TaxID=858423 RepID=UPI0021620837|nr:ABC transporter substrate-binding protein [Bradyrhizobium arachidis]UVO30473.1 ABC transporter substrate-binding protein [Bradyrhizobium arachidis]
MKQHHSLSRRNFLGRGASIGLALAFSGAPFVSRKALGATTISFVSFGGSYGDFAKEYWIKPFTAETGIAVQYVSGPDLAKVKAQVDNKSVEWDVFDAVGATAYAGIKDNLWEPIESQVIDPDRFVQRVADVLVPTFIYAGGIAYDPVRTKNPAINFTDLWDAKKFPGPRGLRSRASETIELALLADGVPASKLYPLDIDRGFKALDAIKPHVKKWFDQTAQGITLIQTGEVDYTYTYANRVKAAKDSGVSIDFSLAQCISAMNYYAIPRGCPRKEAAMRFLEFITRPEQQALMANKLYVIPVTKGAETRLSEEARRWIPDTSNNSKNVFVSDEYWRDHFVAVDKRFKEWILT